MRLLAPLRRLSRRPGNRIPSIRTHTRLLTTTSSCLNQPSSSPTTSRKPISTGLPPSPPSTTSSELLELPRGLPYRRGLLLLSTAVPPKLWPARLEMHSSLLSSANRVLKDSLIAVNMVYDGTGTETALPLHEEKYPAKLYFQGKVFEYPHFNSQTLLSSAFLRDVSYTPPNPPNTTANSISSVSPVGQEGLEVWVCTHGSRDCRCSDKGGPLVDALRNEVKRQGLEGKVRVGEIAHVGGHKYAANAILVPSLDMMSNLDASHAPALLSHLVGEGDSKIWSQWRGRYGLTEESQTELWATVNPDQSVSAEAESSAEKAKQDISLRFKTFDGDIREVSAKIGENLLEVGKRNDLPSLEGVCGGHLECATCHLYLKDSALRPAPVPEPSDEELDMLGYAVGYRDGESRLGCQIRVTKKLEEWVGQGGLIGLPRF